MSEDIRTRLGRQLAERGIEVFIEVGITLDPPDVQVQVEGYGTAAQWEALLAPTYTLEQIEESYRGMVRLMNSVLRLSKVDYQFNEDDAWSDMQKRLTSQRGGTKG